MFSTVSWAQMAFTCAVRKMKNTHPHRTIPLNIFSLLVPIVRSEHYWIGLHIVSCVIPTTATTYDGSSRRRAWHQCRRPIFLFRARITNNHLFCVARSIQHWTRQMFLCLPNKSQFCLDPARCMVCSTMYICACRIKTARWRIVIESSNITAFRKNFKTA